MEVVRELLSEDPSMLLRESMGVAADSSIKAFASSDVTRFMDPSRQLNLERSWQEQVWEVCVAVDPSGGGGSNFAICSIATDIKTGHTVVRTCGSQLFKLPSRTLSLLPATRRHPHGGSGLCGSTPGRGHCWQSDPWR